MKKLILALVFILVSSLAWAAECTVCAENVVQRSADGSVIVAVTVTSSGSACSCTLSDTIQDLRGLYLYSLEVDPLAAAPDNTFDCDVENDEGFHLLDTDDNSNTETTWNPGNATLGQYPKIRKGLVLNIADMGTAGDQAIFYIYGAY